MQKLDQSPKAPTFVEKYQPVKPLRRTLDILTCPFDFTQILLLQSFLSEFIQGVLIAGSTGQTYDKFPFTA
jgi:hypothetical protein